MIKKIKQALLRRKIKKYLRCIQFMVDIICPDGYLRNGLIYRGETMIIEVREMEDVINVVVNLYLYPKRHPVLIVDYKTTSVGDIKVIQVKKYIPGNWEEEIYYIKCAYEYHFFI